MKLGIIGGSGLDNPQLITDYEELEINTPFGNPSSKITCGKIKGVDVCIVSRHGKNHSISPTQINYRANIYALKMLGCTHIIATSAVGSLKQEIKPGDLVFPNQFLDFTKLRKLTFFEKEVRHTAMPNPYSEELRNLLIKGAEDLGLEKHDKATLVVIEGPRFSTKAESNMFRNFADIIGMTGVPECSLANELEIPYATIAMSTDYDCWKEDENHVTFEMVLETMKDNSEKVKKLLLYIISNITDQDTEFIKSRIRTIPNFPKHGILFRDITTLLQDSEAFQKTIEILEKRYKNQDIDLIAGIESRGFILASALALKLKKGVVLIRKQGKLPSKTVSQEYELEYGIDKIEIHEDAIKPNQKVLLIDDLIATGGTASAAQNLIKKIGGNLIETAFIIELPELKGRQKLSGNVFSMVSFEGK